MLAFALCLSGFNPDGVATSDIVTNAVTINEDVLLMANGGAGLCLSEEEDNGTDNVEKDENFDGTGNIFDFAPENWKAEDAKDDEL